MLANCLIKSVNFATPWVLCLHVRPVEAQGFFIASVRHHRMYCPRVVSFLVKRGILLQRQHLEELDKIAGQVQYSIRHFRVRDEPNTVKESHGNLLKLAQIEVARDTILGVPLAVLNTGC